jgi:hypothetical protein
MRRKKNRSHRLLQDFLCFGEVTATQFGVVLPPQNFCLNMVCSLEFGAYLRIKLEAVFRTAPRQPKIHSGARYSSMKKFTRMFLATSRVLGPVAQEFPTYAPLGVGLNLPPKTQIRLRVSAGFSPDFLLSATLTAAPEAACKS